LRARDNRGGGGGGGGGVGERARERQRDRDRETEMGDSNSPYIISDQPPETYTIWKKKRTITIERGSTQNKRLRKKERKKNERTNERTNVIMI
jgi:hypothetical protein